MKTFEQFNQHDDIDPLGEENWDYVPIREWEGTIEDYLKMLNVPRIHYLVDKMKECETREESMQYLDDLRDVIAEGGFDEDIDNALGDLYDEMKDGPFVYDYENESEFDKFWRVDMADYEYGNVQNNNLEYRFNIHMNNLLNNNMPWPEAVYDQDHQNWRIKMGVFTYFHNHVLDRKLREEYMQRIVDGENPKFVAIDIYHKYKAKKKPSQQLENFYNQIKEMDKAFERLIF
jgi:hypothetical protein